jgi:adenylate cyclase class 2
MQVEYEATFENINKAELRKKLKQLNAKLVKPEFKQKRITFNIPVNLAGDGEFIRVRDEGDKITMTYKNVDKTKSSKDIERIRELNLTINDFDVAVELLDRIGCKRKFYQETLREIWEFNGAEITLDTWPFLEPIIEIEGKDEKTVKDISAKLGYDWKDAIFDGIDYFYMKKYNISRERVDNETPKIVFDMQNPFL